jgi:hypothetical protein
MELLAKNPVRAKGAGIEAAGVIYPLRPHHVRIGWPIRKLPHHSLDADPGIVLGHPLRQGGGLIGQGAWHIKYKLRATGMPGLSQQGRSSVWIIVVRRNQRIVAEMQRRERAVQRQGCALHDCADELGDIETKVESLADTSISAYPLFGIAHEHSAHTALGLGNLEIGRCTNQLRLRGCQLGSDIHSASKQVICAPSRFGLGIPVNAFHWLLSSPVFRKGLHHYVVASLFQQSEWTTANWRIGQFRKGPAWHNREGHKHVQQIRHGLASYDSYRICTHGLD